MGPGSPKKAVSGFILKAEDKVWEIGTVLAKFGASFLPPELDPVLTAFKNFRILEPRIEVPLRLAGGDLLLFLAGRPEIAGWKDLVLNGAIMKRNGKTSMAVGFEFIRVNFATVIQKLTSFNVDAIKLLSQTLKVAFMISNDNADDVTLVGSLLKEVPIRRGLTIVAAFSFPPGCNDDFCKFAKGAFGANAQMRLSASISSLREIQIFATASDINLGKGLTLTNTGLEFIIGSKPSFGITATLKLNNPPISFRGAIRVGVQGLELSMTMIGLWKRPFSFEFLAFGNAHLAIALTPGVGVTALEIGGELRLGKIDSGKEIIAAIYLGINAALPQRNYFYGKINKATLKALMDAFEFSVDMPRVLSELGFPHGLETSFAGETIQLPTGLVIPMGFKLNGTLVILGFTVKCDIALNPPISMRIYVELDPLILAGGLIKFTRSSTDVKRGPFLNASITLLPSPDVRVKAKGYVKLFNILNREASLEISNTEFII
eukprot:m.38485 g.38485  ORF g.38485 m.38485 type:complete len:490 (+) comp32601_c0_seq1:1594-3063(+)